MGCNGVCVEHHLAWRCFHSFMAGRFCIGNATNNTSAQLIDELKMLLPTQYVLFLVEQTQNSCTSCITHNQFFMKTNTLGIASQVDSPHCVSAGRVCIDWEHSCAGSWDERPRCTERSDCLKTQPTTDLPNIWMKSKCFCPHNTFCV